MLRFEIHIQDLKIKGHPFQELHKDLPSALSRIKSLKESFPYNDIILYEWSRNEVKREIAKKKPIPKCPWKHTVTTLLGGRPSMIAGSIPGIYICAICGFKVDLNER